MIQTDVVDFQSLPSEIIRPSLLWENGAGVVQDEELGFCQGASWNLGLSHMPVNI